MSARRRVWLIAWVLIGVGLLTAINVRPGWEQVPFLTPETAAALGPINLSLAINVGVALLLLSYDRPVLRTGGAILQSAAAGAACYTLLTVFPFDFSQSWADWSGVVRLVLWVAIFATVVAVLVSLVDLVREIVEWLSPGSGSVQGLPRDDPRGAGSNHFLL